MQLIQGICFKYNASIEAVMTLVQVECQNEVYCQDRKEPTDNYTKGWKHIVMDVCGGQFQYKYKRLLIGHVNV